MTSEGLRQLPLGRRNMTVGVVVLAAILNFVDRQIFSIFMPQIGEDLGINHQQLGFIAGLSFSLFYVVAGFPIARLADRGDRPLIIAGCIAVWSLATAACGLATSMGQLLLARIGLAAGEGGAGPASQSLLLSLFPVKHHTILLGLLSSAGAIGIGAGGALGGWLSQWLNWRESLIIVGLSGLLIALVVWLVAAEPRRGTAPIEAALPVIPLRMVITDIVNSAVLRWIALALISITLAGFPFVIWAGSFFQTVHGMSPYEAGAALFLPITGGMVVGNLLSGWLGSSIARGRPRYQAAIAIVGLVGAFPMGVAAAQASSATASLAFLFAFKVMNNLPMPQLYALGFAQVKSNERAMLGASLTMVGTLCGLGIGTWLVGALSTYFSAHYGDLSLRYALTAVCFALPVGILGAAMAAIASRSSSEPPQSEQPA
jgi:predicted MFS family arabinose efflux permease